MAVYFYAKKFYKVLGRGDIIIKLLNSRLMECDFKGVVLNGNDSERQYVRDVYSLEELRSLKELAINAANDSNTDADRATIQKEFDQKRANIDDIVTMTNYNTKPLLDGRYRRSEIITVTNNGKTGTNNIGASIPKSYKIIKTGVSEPSGNIPNFSYGDIRRKIC